MKKVKNLENKIFVANKPIGLSSNQFLGRIKRKYQVKKAGFSGTLDPFASGALIVAFNDYTKLFRFLKDDKKTYQATLWLGARSESLDNENIYSVEVLPKLSLEKIQEEVEKLKGKINYLPPKYSAKKIDGQRAYSLARKELDFTLKEIQSEVFSWEILTYSHPFLTFKIEVSKGSYIRSLAQILAENLGSFGTLSALKRLSEASMIYEDEKPLNILDIIKIPENHYFGDIQALKLGQKLKVEDFAEQDEKIFYIKMPEQISILEISQGEVTYILNRILL